MLIFNLNNEALFVSLINPYNRLGISEIEIVIRNLGKNKVHPYKFRRIMATMAIDKEVCQSNKYKNCSDILK